MGRTGDRPQDGWALPASSTCSLVWIGQVSVSTSHRTAQPFEKKTWGVVWSTSWPVRIAFSSFSCSFFNQITWPLGTKMLVAVSRSVSEGSLE